LDVHDVDGMQTAIDADDCPIDDGMTLGVWLGLCCKGWTDRSG